MSRPERQTNLCHTESCSICGESLEYLTAASELTCTVCGRQEAGHVHCPRGHYVCEQCHGAGVRTLLRRLLDRSSEVSASPIAEKLMALPELPMLGCEHALIASGAVMTALRNRGVGVTQAHVDEALARTERQAVGAYCGLTGVCGVVPALGACYSVLTGGQCGKGPETRAAMELVSELAAVTAQEADPGCCKAYVRSALPVAEAFLQKRLGIPSGEYPAVVCLHQDRHPHGCRGPGCAYHPEASVSKVLAPEPQTVPGEPARVETGIREESTMSEHQFAESGDATPSSSTAPTAQGYYDKFFDLAYQDGVLNRKTKLLVALGASLAAGCQP
ncbi:MAG: hypothetical protein Kow00129_08330 [Thermoleophilia bacterium]